MSDELSLIQQQIDELEKKKKALVEHNRSQALSEVRKTIALYGFTAGELGVVGSSTIVESTTRKPRRSSDQRQADEKAKHDKSVSDAKSAFERKIQVRKFSNVETGVSKYYWNGKKGILPSGEGVVVKSVEEIV